MILSQYVVFLFFFFFLFQFVCFLSEVLRTIELQVFRPVLALMGMFGPKRDVLALIFVAV